MDITNKNRLQEGIQDMDLSIIQTFHTIIIIGSCKNHLEKTLANRIKHHLQIQFEFDTGDRYKNIIDKRYEIFL